MNASHIVGYLRDSATLKQRLATEQAGAISRAGQEMAKTLAAGGKILIFGNGGSAADAQHLAAELVGRFIRQRVPLPALALTTDASILTAISNDFGFEQVFARQVRALAKPGDVAIAISTSGRSPNVVAGVMAAQEQGLTTIGLTGSDGGYVARSVHIPIVVPSQHTPHVQECHIAVGHLLCEIVETLLFADKGSAPLPSELDGADMTVEKDRVAPDSISLNDIIWDGISLDDLPSACAHASSGSKVVNLEALLALREGWRDDKETVVWTNGCFDLLHVGHIRSLEAARALGDVLVVGLNSDASVRRLKGAQRPIVPEAQRAEVLASLGCVDYVTIFDEATPEHALSRLQPDIHCKGSDYAPPHGRPVPEAHVVEAYGGRVEFLPFVPMTSTSDLIHRIIERRRMP